MTKYLLPLALLVIVSLSLIGYYLLMRSATPLRNTSQATTSPIDKVSPGNDDLIINDPEVTKAPKQDALTRPSSMQMTTEDDELLDDDMK